MKSIITGEAWVTWEYNITQFAKFVRGLCFCLIYNLTNTVWMNSPFRSITLQLLFPFLDCCPGQSDMLGDDKQSLLGRHVEQMELILVTTWLIWRNGIFRSHGEKKNVRFQLQLATTTTMMMHLKADSEFKVKRRHTNQISCMSRVKTSWQYFCWTGLINTQSSIKQKTTTKKNKQIKSAHVPNVIIMFFYPRLALCSDVLRAIRRHWPNTDVENLTWFSTRQLFLIFTWWRTMQMLYFPLNGH